MKAICFLLLFVLSVLAAPEMKKAVLLSAQCFSLYETNGRGYADKLIDGDETNYQATSNLFDQPFFTFVFANYPFHVTYAEIVNRVDCCQDRIDPFTVFLGSQGANGNYSVDYLKTSGMYKHWRESSPGIASRYRVTFPNAQAFYGRVQQHRKDYMNLAEVIFWQMYRPPYLSATSSSLYPYSYPITSLYDSNLTTWFATNKETNSNPWVEVTFAPQKICRVIVWNRYEACCYNRINPFTVAMKNGAFSVRAPSTSLIGQYCGEDGVTCYTSETGALEYYEIDFSTEPVVDRVRVFQQQGDYMNLAELQVYACSFPADFAYQS